MDSRVSIELQRQVGLGYFDCAVAGTIDGVVATVGPVGADSLFEIASVSKTFTFLLAALLRYEGRLDIDVPFVRYLPDHALAKTGTDITIRDLATHASGFTDGWMARAGIYNGFWPYACDGEYERALLSQLPEFSRRTKYNYACSNAILMGFIIERILGVDLDSAARKYVWGPLGMASTTWNNVPSCDPRLVQIYTKGKRPLGTKGDENARGCSRPIGNAGVFSSFADLSRYAADMLDRKAFPREVYDLLTTPTFEEGGRLRAFGWDMSVGTNPPGWGGRSINHSGYTGQYMAVDLESGRSAIVLTNLRLTDAQERAKAYEDRRCLASLLTDAPALPEASSLDPSDIKRKAFEALADVAVSLPPEIRTSDLEGYSPEVLAFAMNNGLALSPGGRLWASWISGGDGAKSFTVAAWSDDCGESWTDAKLVIDGHEGKLTDRTNIIGTFWLDPDGRLHLFTDQTICHFDGRAGVWESICDNADAESPVWSAPRRLCHGHLLNKPIVLGNGDWAMSVYLNKINGHAGEWPGAFPELDAERGVTCLVSHDRGRSWEKRGIVREMTDWQESQLVQRDNVLQVYIRAVRNGEGCLLASESTDGGYSWTEAHRLAGIDNTNARFQIVRLKSGRYLFVKHGEIGANAANWKGRERLSAYLSDDGENWRGGLLLDSGCGSYPDCCQADDGTIYVTHDHGRDREGEIWLHRFTEDDILAGKIVSPRGRLGLVVFRALGTEYNRKGRQA